MILAFSQMAHYIGGMISYQLLVIAVALGCDAFSVAIGVGSQGLSARRIFRLTWHFALFQFIMPLIGLGIGETTAKSIGEAGIWIASGGLALIGIRMAREGLRHPAHRIERKDPTRGWSLIALSVSTSVDALVAGFSLGLIGVHILIACTIIGIVAGMMTAIGMLLGAGAAKALGRGAEVGGGLVLIALAVAFVL
jgi:manganese efflux pump family protein